MNEPLDLENLRHWVRERRRELDLSHLEIQQLGGPSTTTMTKIEAGRGPAPRRDVVKRLEHVLGWPQGTVRRILAGGSPDMVQAGSEDGPSRLAELIAERSPNLADEVLAAIIGIDEATVSGWRLHRHNPLPDPEVLRRLAAFLEIEERETFFAAGVMARYIPEIEPDQPTTDTA